MEPLVTRRNALELSLLAVPAASILLSPRTAFAQSDPLVAVQASSGPSSDAEAKSTAKSAAVPVVYSGARVQVRARAQGAETTGWAAGSKTMGTASDKGKGLVVLGARLVGLQGVDGHVRYRVYKRKAGWRSWAKDGSLTDAVRNVEAVKISLTGTVAAHYDVLYRVYMSGRGWTAWAKNGAACGATGKGSRVNAIQVKLSAKTQEAAGKSLSTVGVRYEARVAKTGWQPWVAAGETAGTTGKSRALRAIAVVADAGRLGGSVKYRAHVADVGWMDWVGEGKTAGTGSKRLEAVCIKLTGKLAKSYDVYYRAHVANYGWLDWAKNGAAAGSTGFSIRMEAMQAKLVKKGGAAPGTTKYPTVNKLEQSKRLNGIDIASWQADINISAVPGQFVIVKATQGDWYTNPYFRQQVDATLACGKLLGIYHFADLRGSAAAQANYFINAVKPYLGQCVLALDWEQEALALGSAWAKKFMDRVYKKTGVKPLIYMSQSQTYAYDWSSVAANYRLWVAQYLYRNENTGYLSSPAGGTNLGYWSSATIYQYSSTGQLKGYGSSLDLDKFYGSAAIWRKLCNGE